MARHAGGSRRAEVPPREIEAKGVPESLARDHPAALKPATAAGNIGRNGRGPRVARKEAVTGRAAVPSAWLIHCGIFTKILFPAVVILTLAAMTWAFFRYPGIWTS